jgi:hypothetical protein
MERTIVEFQPSDRNIVLFSVNDKLIGVNFWQGLGDISIANGFLSPDHSIDVKNFLGKPLSTAIELIDVLDDLIWKSIEQPTSIPKEQRKLIKKALRFYMETSKKLNELPTESENYDLFGMSQLCEMMDYPMSIDISQYEKQGFESKHGVVFPIYDLSPITDQSNLSYVS